MENKETYKNLGLRSEPIRDLITEVPQWSLRWGSLVIFGTIITFLMLSWMIKYPDKITATGMLTAENAPQKLYARTSGAIDSLFVVNGQEVEKGQMLSIIDNSADTEDLLFLKNILDDIHTEEDLRRVNMDSIRFLEIGEIRMAYEVFENALVDYMVNSELAPMELKEMASRATLSEQRSLLNSLGVKLSLNQKQLRLKRTDLNRARTLFQKGVISQKELDGYEYVFIAAESELREINEQVMRLRNDVYGAELDTLDKAASTSRTEQKALASAVNALSILKKDINRWEEAYVLKSRITGKVSFFNVLGKNSHVNSGELVFTIIPKRSGIYGAVLRAKPFNSGKIRKDQRINFVMPNYPEADFGILIGYVSSISLTTNQQGLYVVNGALDSTLVTTHGIPIEFSYDMPVEGEIITENKSLLMRMVNFLSIKTR